MRRATRVLGVLMGSAIGAAASDAGQSGSRTAAGPAMAAMPPSPMPRPAKMTLGDVVRPEFRDAVLKVVRDPTISTKADGEEVVCTVAVYEWLFDHPDRVALAWQRLKVPSITITDQGGGRFAWSDEHGSMVAWQTVGTFPDGRVWYASGKVKAGRAAPSIPVQGVIIVTHPKKAEKDGVALFAPTAQAFLHTDSRAASLALRALGPTAPKLAEDAAGQLLDFYGGIANYVQKHPNDAEKLLGPGK